MTRHSISSIIAAATLAVSSVTAHAQGAARPASLAGDVPRPTLASVAGGARASALADTAITQLEGFLARYPNSALRPNALFQLGELLVRRADDQFNAAQRGGNAAAGDSVARSDAPIRPAYGPAIARYEELVTRYPTFERVDAAAYTLGTMYSVEQRYADAARMFGIVAGRDSSRFNGEGLFRLGDAQFELAAKERGDARRALFSSAASAYDRAAGRVPRGSDLYYLSLYKLGWSYYNQGTLANQEPYRKAVATFGQLVDAYDKLTPEQQNRLGLRGEAIEYMAVAFTQVGGAEAANRYFESSGRGSYKLPVLRRVAQSLRDQGDFVRAVEAYQTVLAESPNDTSALAAQREIVDIYQNRMLEPEKAQAARLTLIEKFAPNTPWAQANPTQSAIADTAREEALRQTGQYLLASAQKGSDRARYGEAAAIYQRYVNEYAKSDSARAVTTYLAEALFGQGNYAEAGTAFSRAAYGVDKGDSASARLSEDAGRSAVVAFDSALVRNRTDRAAQDSLFASVDRFVAAHPQSDVAKKALIEKGRRASESERWDVMAQAFRDYAGRYPTDAYAPTAQKLVGDALYKSGQYAEAQTQWVAAQTAARQAGRPALADSIVAVRATAATLYADTLIRRGNYSGAAEEVYVAYADANPGTEKAADALRNAVETYMLVVDSGRTGDVDIARNRAIVLSTRLVREYPSYRYRAQYQNLNARLLAQAGRKEEAVAALRQVIAGTPRGPAQSAAMIRLASALDSAGQKKEAAAAYESFAVAYPTDERAADAQFNAAVTFVEAGDTASASRAYSTFATRFPRDARAGQARERRVVLLRSVGDTTTANVELARLCANPTSDAVRQECAAQSARRAEVAAKGAFDRAVQGFAGYREIKIAIPTRRQLTAAGIKAAQARKLAALRQLTSQFEGVIRSGSPEYVAAGTWYVGLLQHEYGTAFKNVELPPDLTPEERQAATAGAAGQAEPYFTAAKTAWQALVDKAEQDATLKNDERARPWLEKARNALAGNVATDAGE